MFGVPPMQPPFPLNDPDLENSFAQGIQAGKALGSLLDKKFAIIGSVWTDEEQPRIIGLFSGRGVEETAQLARQVAAALEDLANPNA